MIASRVIVASGVVPPARGTPEIAVIRLPRRFLARELRVSLEPSREVLAEEKRRRGLLHRLEDGLSAEHQPRLEHDARLVRGFLRADAFRLPLAVPVDEEPPLPVLLADLDGHSGHARAAADQASVTW